MHNRNTRSASHSVSVCVTDSDSNTTFVDARQPVASNVPISRETFYARFEELRNALIAQARRYVGQADEDVVGQTLLVAYNAWAQGRYTDPTSARGPGAFAGWLRRILRDCIVDHQRREGKRQRYEAPLEGGDQAVGDDVHARWAMLAAEDDKRALADIELLHEARLRMQFADLTDMERLCLGGRCQRKKLKQLQAELEARGVERGSSKSAISRHIKSAVEKCRRVPAEMLSAPDVDRYAWRVANDATIYRAPTTTGSALSREKHRLSEYAFQQSAR